jgi:phenylalanyl-tRNA synthetase alpha chain
MTDLKNLQKDINQDLKTLSSEELKKKYLDSDGIIREMFSQISNIEKDQRAQYGQSLNKIKKQVEERIQELATKEISQKARRIDPTAPFDLNNKSAKRPRIWDLHGSSHILMDELDKFIDIFKTMGFDIVESRQIDDDFHMFESLNFPKGHPARDMYDTFWTEDGFVLPAHTSTMQNRILTSSKPPIRATIPGRCFRNESTDSGHEHTFFQIEGVYVDKDVSIANMIATIKEFLESYLETTLDVKIQPAYFPFTEPDAEFAISCPFCDKKGCSTCGYTGWIELMGCGMIHPNVLKSASIDPDKYSGFAWGFGLDRLAMIKNHIPEIRDLRAGNIKFLRKY